MTQEQPFHNVDPSFPFCAVVGQGKAKQALMMLAVNDRLRSVLLSGPSGTGKTVLARSFTALFPAKRRVNVPLNVSEDRLLGSIDVERALESGERRYQPGLLAEAHRHILTVDDIHLMDEAAVHAIATAIEAGAYTVEREGMSVSCSVDGLLVAVMNPEEGDVSPGLLDCFSMVVPMPCLPESGNRQLIARHVCAYEQNPHVFTAYWEKEMGRLRAAIAEAKACLSKVEVSEEMLELAVWTSTEAKSAGHRADYYLVEAAKAIAALDRRTHVEGNDMRQAAELVLLHRMRRDRTEERQTAAERPIEPESGTAEQRRDDNGVRPDRSGSSGGPDHADNGQVETVRSTSPSDLQQTEHTQALARETIESVGQAIHIKKWFAFTSDNIARTGTGKRSTTKSGTKQGRYVKYSSSKGQEADIAVDATLRAAAPYQKMRHSNGNTVWNITSSDLHYKVREKRTGVTMVFVVDSSRSMAAGKRMKAVKGAIFSLLRDAYQKRDRVGMVTFRQAGAHEVLPITRSIDLAEKRLRELPTGGKTPLVHGLKKGYELLRQAVWRDPEIMPAMIVLTDGKANVGLNPNTDVQDAIEQSREMGQHIHAAGMQSLVIDTEQSFVKLHLAETLASAMYAHYCRLDELTAAHIADTVKAIFNR